MKRIYGKVLASLLAAPAIALAISATAQATPLDGDHGYQAYLAWNGFHSSYQAAQGGAAATTQSGYHAYQRWNGFQVEQAGVSRASDGFAGQNTADSAYQAYRRWNGFSS